MERERKMNVSQNTEVKKEEKKKKPLLIIILILIILILLGALAFFLLNNNSKTAIIVDTDMQLQDVDADGQLRVKMNPYINIQEDTMQNLEFYNLNEGRYLQLKIKVGDKYVYEGPMLETGKVIKGDLIDTKNLPKGETEAIAEIYSYSLEEKPMGQTNVEVILNCK